MIAPAIAGLVGCGEIAQRYARDLAGHSQTGLRLTAVTDLDAAVGSSLAVAHALRFVPSFDELLAMPLDLICVCTPNATHASIALRALEAGHHVLLEHPMAMQSADAERLIAAARVAGRELFVVRQRRFSRAVQTVRAALAAGLFGVVKRVALKVHWSRRRAYYDEKPWRRCVESGGVVANQGSHFLDLLLYLFGEPVGLSGVIGNVRHAIACEDAVCGTIEFSCGMRAAFECTTAAPDGCNLSSLAIDGERMRVTLAGRDLARLAEPVPPTLAALADTAPPLTGDHRGYFERVARRIAGEPTEVVDGTEGARAVRLVDAIYATFRRDDAPLRAHFRLAFGETPT